MKLFLSMLLALTGIVALGAPKADPEKPLYQFTWGGPPPFSMTVFGSMEEVENDVTDNEGEKSADMWQDLAKYSAWGALALTLLWYFSSKREIGGAAGVSLACSLGCTVMAEIVTNAWLIALLVVGGLIALGLGYLWRDKSGFAWIGKKLKRKPQPDRKG